MHLALRFFLHDCSLALECCCYPVKHVGLRGARPARHQVHPPIASSSVPVPVVLISVKAIIKTSSVINTTDAVP